MKTTHEITIPPNADWSVYENPLKCPGVIALQKYFETDFVLFQDEKNSDYPQLERKAIVVKDGEAIEFQIDGFEKGTAHTFTITELGRKPIDMEYVKQSFEEKHVELDLEETIRKEFKS